MLSMLRLVTCMSILLTLLIISLLIPQYVVGKDVYTEVTYFVKDLEDLHSMGVDVGLVIDLLNKAMEEYRRGKVAEAQRYLDEARRIIDELKLVAESVYLKALVVKIATVGSLAVLPVAVYLILPRMYLYLWFKLHRKWIVR